MGDLEYEKRAAARAAEIRREMEKPSNKRKIEQLTAECDASQGLCTVCSDYAALDENDRCADCQLF